MVFFGGGWSCIQQKLRTIGSGNDVAALQHQGQQLWGYLRFFLTRLTHWYKDDYWTLRHPVCISSRKKRGKLFFVTLRLFIPEGKSFQQNSASLSLWRTVSNDCLLTREAGKLNIQISNFYSRGRQRRNFLSGLTSIIWHDVIWILWCIKMLVCIFIVMTQVLCLH